MVESGMRIRHLVCVAGLSIVIVACQSGVQKIATPVPTEAHAKVSGKSLPVLKRGHGVYMRHCSQCHEHRLPNTITLPDWHAKIEAMSVMAGLSEAEKDNLQEYLGEFSDR